jgi:hypothetical protein
MPLSSRRCRSLLDLVVFQPSSHAAATVLRIPAGGEAVPIEDDRMQAFKQTPSHRRSPSPLGPRFFALCPSIRPLAACVAVGLMLVVALTQAQTFAVRDVSPAGENAELMSMAADANGNALVLWSMLGPTSDQLAVRSSRYDSATDSWGAPVDLIRRPSAYDPKYRLHLLALPSGDALAIGTAIYGTQYGAEAVVYARYSVSANTWGAITVLSPSGVDWPVSPSAVVAADGVVTAVWAQDCNGCSGHTLLAARYAPTTGTWTTQALEGGLFAATYDFEPTAAIDGDGNVLVVFSKATPPGQTIYARRFSAGAAAWSPSEVIAASACDSGCGDGGIAVDTRGNALVTWRGLTGQLESTHFDAMTGAWGNIQVVSPSATSSGGLDSLAADATGNFVATWTTPFSSGNPSWLVRRFSSASHTWGPVTTLSDNGYWGNVVIDRSGNVTAVWYHNGSPSGIKGARFDAAAGSWSGAIDLAVDTASARAISPGLTIDAVGNVRVSWQRYPLYGVGQRIVQSAVWPAGATSGPPGAPTNLHATVSGNTINLTWGAPTSGATPTEYSLIGRTTAGGPVLAVMPMGAGTSFSVVAPNGTFVVTVNATNAHGTGPESSAVTVAVPQMATAPPGSPSNLTATVSGTTANFTWTAPASGGPAEGYVLVAGLSPGFAAPIAVLPLGASTSVSVPAVPPGTYYVRVLAMNALGTGGASNETTVSVAAPSMPGPPSVNPPQVSGGTVTLSWSAGSGGAPTGYTLFASTTPGGVPIATVPVAGTSISFTNVPNGTYYVRVRASNAQGTSAPSAEVILTVGPPTASSLVPLINAWRARAGVAPVVEEPSWSAGAALHARYVLFANESGQSQSFHEENPRSSYFTIAGNEAARNSIVFHSLLYADYPGDRIISSWARSPFVSLQMLDPVLHRTGLSYLSRNEPAGNGVYRTGAVLDVTRGRNEATPLAGPVTFPRDGGAVAGECAERTGYTACGSEGFPPMLGFCGIRGNGYTTPDFGMPVWIQFGGSVNPVVSAVSLTRAGTAVPVCTLTADSYTIATADVQTLGRRILRERGAVVLVPRTTLPTGLYTASVTANGQQHRWTFTVQ